MVALSPSESRSSSTYWLQPAAGGNGGIVPLLIAARTALMLDDAEAQVSSAGVPLPPLAWHGMQFFWNTGSASA